MDLSWLNGYALITETPDDRPARRRERDPLRGRRRRNPAGQRDRHRPSRRVVEKNHDARLLSPGSLLDRLARPPGPYPPHLAGPPATVRDRGGDPLRRRRRGRPRHTGRGVEALRCTGLPETLVYRPGAGRPVGQADPVGARPSRGAGPGDRHASPISPPVRLAGQLHRRARRPTARTIDLFAWLTLANGDDESFVAAPTPRPWPAARPGEDEGDKAAEPVRRRSAAMLAGRDDHQRHAARALPPPPPPGECTSGADGDRRHRLPDPPSPI